MSIHRTKYGTYRVRWRAAGKLKSQSFSRKVDAEKFEAATTLGLTTARVMPSDRRSESSPVFGEFAETWIRDHGLVHKTAGSLVRDRQIIRDYFGPRFSRRRLSDISRIDVVEMQSELVRRQKLSAKSINNIMGLLHKMLSDAMHWEILRSNPAAAIRRVKSQAPEMLFWAKDEVRRFSAFCRSRNPGLCDIVEFAVNSGMRSGEIEGLKRDCLDFERREIVVKRSVCKKTGVCAEHTKAKRVRRIPMNETLYRLLLAHRLKAPEQFVFEVKMKNLARAPFQVMCRRAGVTRIRFHDLRHTFASHLVMAGVAIYVVKELLGHSTIVMTERYSHLAPGHLAGVTDVLCGSAFRNIEVAGDSCAQ